MQESPRLGIDSEVDTLKLALVHQPGYEHRKTIPWNKEALLFDDILDVEEARPEHKEFTRLLTVHGVRVLYFLDLLRDLFSDRAIFSDLLEEVLPVELLEQVDLSEIRPTDLVNGLPERSGLDQGLHLEPLPNLYFIRDPLIFVPGMIVVGRPARAARRREAHLVAAVAARHPIFSNTPIHREFIDDPDVTIEGGDVQVPDPTTVLIGIGERTNEAGAEKLAQLLFAETPVTRVGKIYNPPRRDFMHLDAVLTFVDRRRVLTLPYLWTKPEVYLEVASRCRRRSEELREPYSGPLPDAFSQSCRLVVEEASGGAPRKYDNVLEGLAEEGIIEIKDTVFVGGPERNYDRAEEHVLEGLREQWNDAANVLALKPGQVMAYARNDRTFRALEEEGIEVVSFSGGELVRGRGGPRAMVNPLGRSLHP